MSGSVGVIEPNTKLKRKRKKVVRFPKDSDEWDGSIDNQEKVLEDHVSKHGWQF